MADLLESLGSGGAGGLLAAVFACLGFSRRLNKLENSVVFKDTFEQVQTARKEHDDVVLETLGEIKSDIRSINETLLRMPKRRDE